MSCRYAVGDDRCQYESYTHSIFGRRSDQTVSRISSRNPRVRHGLKRTAEPIVLRMRRSISQKSHGTISQNMVERATSLTMSK